MLCELDPALVAAPIMLVVFAIFGLIAFVVFLFKLFLWWKIFAKTGFSGAFALLMLAPFGSLIIMCILAFSKWPSTNKPQLPQQQV